MVRHEDRTVSYLYSAFCLDADDRLANAIEICALGDDDAIATVHAFKVTAFVIELWEGARFVRRFETI